MQKCWQTTPLSHQVLEEERLDCTLGASAHRGLVGVGLEGIIPTQTAFFFFFCLQHNVSFEPINVAFIIQCSECLN